MVGLPSLHGAGAGAPSPIAIVIDPHDPVGASGPVQWAAGELTRALAERGASVRQIERVEHAGRGELCVACAGPMHGGWRDNAGAAQALRGIGIALAAGPERFAIASVRHGGQPMMVVCGSDSRGLTYALLELADRGRRGITAGTAFGVRSPVVGRPANPVRSVMRQVTCERFDAPWLHDREGWLAYLTMLATHRFNRLHLGFGLGYDFLQHVADSYTLFLYPFLVRLPGSDVTVTNVTDADRARNLATLRFISDEAAARGLTFQLGIWMHGYSLANSPDARYVVQGLTPATHASYCRDALTEVLRACPSITAVALRIHGESGVAEGSYEFWQTVFDGVRRCGRAVEIDLHAKGLDHDLIDRALATGMPVNVSPKYWAEHIGLPYHQASIRELERPVAGQNAGGLMALSAGSLSYTRYGFGELLREDRHYTVRHRVWFGSQRVLLSADPAATAAHAHRFQFCGSDGMDLMEPLTFRGRRGSAVAEGRRSGYADTALEPRRDWEKYDAWYRTWGRLTYDSGDTNVEEVRRAVAEGLGEPLQRALALASRILPMVTTAYAPSAACDAYWPEICWNQPLVAIPDPNPYSDTPAPKTFQHASPLDPQLFTSMAECATEFLAGESSGRYTPLDVAAWLERLATDVTTALSAAGTLTSIDARRAAVDVAIQGTLGRFFAAKMRAGVLYAIHERTGSRAALDAAVRQYHRARDAWSEAAERSATVYGDLSISDKISERGRWSDRLPAIDRDIDALVARRPTATAGDDPRTANAIARAQAEPQRPAVACIHQPPADFRPGEDVPLSVQLDRDAPVESVHCWYRRVNQAERFQSVELTRHGAALHGVIPSAYTASAFPLQYYFVVRLSPSSATIVPGLGKDLLNQPYIVLRQRDSASETPMHECWKAADGSRWDLGNERPVLDTPCRLLQCRN